MHASRARFCVLSNSIQARLASRKPETRTRSVQYAWSFALRSTAIPHHSSTSQYLNKYLHRLSACRRRTLGRKLIWYWSCTYKAGRYSGFKLPWTLSGPIARRSETTLELRSRVDTTRLCRDAGSVPRQRAQLFRSKSQRSSGGVAFLISTSFVPHFGEQSRIATSLRSSVGATWRSCGADTHLLLKTSVSTMEDSPHTSFTTGVRLRPAGRCLI